MASKSSKPEKLFCRICGSKFDRESLLTHEKSCWKSWAEKNAPEQLEDGKLNRSPSIEGEMECQHCGKSSIVMKDISTSLLAGPSLLDDEKKEKTSPAKKSIDEPGVEIAKLVEDKPKKVKDPDDKPPEIKIPTTTPLRTKSNWMKGPPKNTPSAARIQTRRTFAVGGPKFIYCSLCGKPYGSESILIHEPQCLKKWRLANSMLPPRMRRPEPHLPNREPGGTWASSQKPFPGRDRYPSAPTAGASADDYMDPADYEAWQNHLSSLVPCSFCKRTFFPHRVMYHESCCIERKKDTRKKSTGMQTYSIDSRYN